MERVTVGAEVDVNATLEGVGEGMTNVGELVAENTNLSVGSMSTFLSDEGTLVSAQEAVKKIKIISNKHENFGCKITPQITV